ncbi:1-acyl-sn-glycerol-3-phosphate acyltransferase, partial [Pseudomonas sp. HMWF031]
VKWNRWNNGIVLIDIAAPQALSEDKTIKEWMVHFNDEMKQKFDALNTQVDELEKSR